MTEVFSLPLGCVQKYCGGMSLSTCVSHKAHLNFKFSVHVACGCESFLLWQCSTSYMYLYFQFGGCHHVFTMAHTQRATLIPCGMLVKFTRLDGSACFRG